VLRKLTIVMVAFAALVIALPGHGTSLSPSSAEAYPGADNFTVIGQDCLGPNNVRLYLQWTSYGFGPQWFDVSLQNNGFAPTTFVGAGPIASGQGNFVWEGFVPGARHYLRVNTLTQFGWAVSQTYQFVTQNCGGGGGKNGPKCDGIYWCAGDPIPSFCAQEGLYNGCIWVDRIANPYAYTQFDQVRICFWIPVPAYVVVQTVRLQTGVTTVQISQADNGQGDCAIVGPGLVPDDRRTTLQINGNAYATDQVLWRVN
jgi:hypothetical protein